MVTFILNINIEQYICEFCNGIGRVFLLEHGDFLQTTGASTCTVCHGKKKLDWISNIIKPKGYIPETDLEMFNREIWWDGSVVYVKRNIGP